MKIRCEYCDSYISDTDEVCKNCGGVNNNLKRIGNGVPTTIEELKKWYVDHNLPPKDVTRFFIGEDYKNPKAFGIYYDDVTQNYVVYKNKDTGVRVVRYEGKDEKYAVNELYLKLKEEIQNQKNRNNNSKNSDEIEAIFNNSKLLAIHICLTFLAFIIGIVCGGRLMVGGIILFLTVNPGVFIMLGISQVLSKRVKLLKKISDFWHISSIVIYFSIILIPGFISVGKHWNDSYYKDGSSYYYLYGDNWYVYDNDTYGWTFYDGDTSNFDKLDKDYDYFYDFSDFKGSSYYDEDDTFFGKTDSYSSSSSSDWDSGSSWDSSDSWDSGGTDWGSDW